MTYPYPKPIRYDSLKAKMARTVHRGSGWCGRCGMPWPVAEPHVTNYNEHSGLFPLCEICWVFLGSPIARVEYYNELISWWKTDPKCEITADDETNIELAVASGG